LDKQIRLAERGIEVEEIEDLFIVPGQAGDDAVEGLHGVLLLLAIEAVAVLFLHDGSEALDVAGEASNQNTTSTVVYSVPEIDRD